MTINKVQSQNLIRLKCIPYTKFNFFQHVPKLRVLLLYKKETGFKETCFKETCFKETGFMTKLEKIFLLQSESKVLELRNTTYVSLITSPKKHRVTQRKISKQKNGKIFITRNMFFL